MMHKSRRWCVSAAQSPEALARLLTDHTWTLCTGFCVAGHEEYLFLNDATVEDGGEYAVVKGRVTAREHLPVESVTFSWCAYEQALSHIQSALAGAYDRVPFPRTVRLALDTPERHGRCPHCG